MSDLISRRQAIDALDDAEDAFGYLTRDWEEVLMELPSVQPETTTMTVGRTKGEITMWYECDNCGEPVDQSDNYCRNCGRRFKKDE